MLDELTGSFPGLGTFEGLALDLDGTLLDTRPELVAACVASGKEHGFEVDEALASQRCGHGVIMMLEAVAPHLDVPTAAAARESVLVYYEQHLGSQTTWLLRADLLVEYFRGLNKPVAIVTNKHSRYTLPLLDFLGLASMFSPVICRDTFAQPKPDPAGLLHVAKHWQLSPKSILWIGDSQTDADAGKAAGMPTLILRSGFVPGKEIVGQGDWQIESFSDLKLNSIQ